MKNTKALKLELFPGTVNIFQIMTTAIKRQIIKSTLHENQQGINFKNVEKECPESFVLLCEFLEARLTETITTDVDLAILEAICFDVRDLYSFFDSYKILTFVRVDLDGNFEGVICAKPPGYIRKTLHVCEPQKARELSEAWLFSSAFFIMENHIRKGNLIRHNPN